jgi:hypothetical protein
MAANYLTIKGARIISGGGPVTEDVYVDDGSTDLDKGELCYLSAGTILPVDTTGALDTGSDGFAAAHRFFLSLEDVDASVNDGGNINVQEVLADTVFEGYVTTSNADGVVTIPQTAIGVSYAGYLDANGRTSLDVNNTTNPVFTVTDVMDNYDPWRIPDSEDVEEDSGGVRHDRVKFRILTALIA